MRGIQGEKEEETMGMPPRDGIDTRQVREGIVEIGIVVGVLVFLGALFAVISLIRLPV